MRLRAPAATGVGLLLAACAVLQPTPSASTIPVQIVNEDDEPARVEVTLYSALEGRERKVREPFEIAPGESTRIDVEPTLERDGAFHVIVNGYVAVTSEFMCDPGDIGQPAAALPRSVRVRVVDDGTPAVCPFVEAE